jgi:peptidoglycan L-alanyl-D-glutamate endopeptidase CwlK
MPIFSKQSLGKLATCDPRLQDILNEAIKIVDITVIQGFRNKFDQDAAVASGHSKVSFPHGKHNSLPSRAVDIAPYHMGVGIDWSDLIAFGRMMGVIQAIAHAKGIRLRFGLDWDGDFRSVGPDPDESFLDAPHVELVDP